MFGVDEDGGEVPVDRFRQDGVLLFEVDALFVDGVDPEHGDKTDARDKHPARQVLLDYFS